MMNSLNSLPIDTRSLKQNDRGILKSLYQLSPQPLENFNSMMKAIVKLESLKLIRIEGERVELLSLGEQLMQTLQDLNATPVRKISPRVAASQQRRCERSDLFLELYKQGKSCQQIGNLYDISRARVHQILARNPAYHDYLAELERTRDRFVGSIGG